MINLINKFRIKKGSIIFTWLISYLIILLIPLIIGSVIYVQTSKVLENEINNSNAYALKQVQQDIDNLLNDIQRMLAETSLNPRIQELLVARGNLDDNQRYDARKVIQDLKLYSLHSKYLYDFYIYFPKIDIIMTPSTLSNSANFYYGLYKDTSLSYNDWQKIICGRHNGEYLSLEINEQSESSISYVHSIPLIGYSELSANVVFMIDQSKILETARDIAAFNDGSIFIINENDDVLAKTGDGNLPENIKYSSMREENGILFEVSGKEKVMVNYITSDATGWKYVAVIPNNVFWDKIEYVRRLMFINVVLCVAIGSIFMLFAIRKNYMPIQDLIQIFGTQSQDNKNNEYSVLRQAINKTIDEKEKIQNILKRHNNSLRNNYITRMLKGRVGSYISMDEALEWYDIQFKSDRFAVILFYIKDYGVFCDEDNLHDGEGYKLVRVALTNVVEELIGEKNKAFMTEADDMMACLVNLSDDDDDWFSEISGAVDKTQEFLVDNFYLCITASISGMHKKSGIHIAYNEAVEAMEYKLVRGLDRIIQFSDISKIKESGYNYPFEKELQLINIIKSGDYEKGESFLDEILSDNFETANLSIQSGKCLLFILVSTMIKTVSGGKDNEFLEETNPIGRIAACETYDRAGDELKKILYEFCNYLKVDDDNALIRLVDDTIEYIKKNYNDINLTVGSIAERFNVNISYLSKVFKEQKGEGLLDYIHKVRIAKVKEMFLSEDMNLEDMASVTGFSSVRTLARVFKKYEGITTGQFRNIFK